ncbi:MAG: gliding motility protein GldL [Bacteroidales bacterium]|nr:gliding motility protein GldL [Bacteroidales bacterium]
MSIAEIVQSSGWKTFMAKLYGIGAAVVIIGALFKIQHYPMAGTLLFIGLMTEAIIFFFSAFEPLHEDPDWSLVYPELAGVPETEEEMALQASRSVSHGHIGGGGGGGGGAGSAALAKFDELLVEADITPDLFAKLGKGLKKLSDTTTNVNAMGDITAATDEFAEKVKGATETFGTHTENYAKSSEALGASLGKLDESYQSTAQIISNTGVSYQHMTESLSKIEMGGKSYQDQLESVNKNLSALNAVYELQLQGANNQVKETEAMMKGVNGMISNLKDSAEEATKYREQIGHLNENLTALNSVYGNMLSAMNVK